MTICFSVGSGTGPETEILEDRTKPLPPFTEAGLLAAMENAGGTADGESNKKTTERCGLGTPGTRAGIIDLLVARRYVERIGNRLIPTKKGLEIYGIVGDKLIADAAMTAAWEEALCIFLFFRKFLRFRNNITFVY